MNRSLAGFLIFLAGLVLVAVIGVWYLGMPVVGLAFDDERRAAPYYALHFSAAAPAGATTSDTAGSRGPFLALATGEDGQLLWQAVTARVVDGRLEDDWREVLLIEFARGGDFVEMVTSTAYRDIAAPNAAAPHMLMGTGTAPDSVTSQAVAVLFLWAVAEDTAGVEVVARSLFQHLADFDGSLTWDAAADVIEGGWPWNRLLLAQFPDRPSAEAWLRDPGTETEMALSAKAVRRAAVLLLQPAAAE